MLFFGPCTVKHGGVDLGKTFGGISINLISHQGSPIGSYSPEYTLVGGEATVNFKQWSSAIDISSTTSLSTWGIVLLDASPDYLITISSCKIIFDVSTMNLGVNQQSPVKLKLVFRPDTSGNVIKFE